jgi:hypothetical protein
MFSDAMVIESGIDLSKHRCLSNKGKKLFRAVYLKVILIKYEHQLEVKIFFSKKFGLQHRKRVEKG